MGRLRTVPTGHPPPLLSGKPTAPRGIMTALDISSPIMTTPRLPVLSLLETRVLGVLCEKQHTVPNNYPLSLNALVAGCNQMTCRHPIMEASEAEKQTANNTHKRPAQDIESS